jgi:hypothetical protein
LDPPFKNEMSEGEGRKPKKVKFFGFLIFDARREAATGGRADFWALIKAPDQKAAARGVDDRETTPYI